MLERDRRVTRELWGRGIPMAVTTAGGYRPSSWCIHFNYFHWLLSAGALGHHCRLPLGAVVVGVDGHPVAGLPELVCASGIGEERRVAQR